MTNVLIRACAHQDLEGILELDKLWNDEGVAYVWYGNREDLVEAFERFPKYFLLAESDGCIVGYVNGSVRTNETVEVLPKQQRYLEVENIYVRSEFRDMRVGGDLLERDETRNVSSICGYLAVIVSGLSSGAMLTGAMVVVPFWRSISAAEFLAWFAANADRMQFYFGPLQVATIVVTVASAILFGIGHRSGKMLLSIAAVLAIAVLATYPLYFRSVNASFVAASIPITEVPNELARWAWWQWVRTVIGLFAFVFSVLGMTRADASASSPAHS